MIIRCLILVPNEPCPDWENANALESFCLRLIKNDLWSEDQKVYFRSIQENIFGGDRTVEKIWESLQDYENIITSMEEDEKLLEQTEDKKSERAFTKASGYPGGRTINKETRWEDAQAINISRLLVARSWARLPKFPLEGLRSCHKISSHTVTTVSQNKRNRDRDSSDSFSEPDALTIGPYASTLRSRKRARTESVANDGGGGILETPTSFELSTPTFEPTASIESTTEATVASEDSVKMNLYLAPPRSNSWLYKPRKK